MSQPIPYLEDDVCRRLAQVAPGHCVLAPDALRDAWPGDEVRVEDGAPARALFVQYVASVPALHLSTHVLQLLVRGEPGKRNACRERATACANAIAGMRHAGAGFVGYSGTRYSDVRLTGMRSLGPDTSTDRPYFVVDLEVVQDG